MNVRTIIRLVTAAACTAGIAAVGPTGTAQAADQILFGSPSGNIACAIFAEGSDGGAGYVRCEVFEYTYTPPPRPPGCYLPDGTPVQSDYGYAIHLSKAHGAWFNCGGGTLGHPINSFLPYGASVTFGGFTCTSARDGIRCGVGSKSFRISRAAYELS
ncbi:DUF6636 domain-containing protein [Nocardia sp. XZ_19_385]|uniref:DUF6636 domain-containing protein n=1 Tax=Nocardia sp. XZ_19_385 TaxID=2769488 RepID=UPI001890B387|nr:DUF6636 domain-containing protein [Nocardia sp. XZ_19_385]